MKKPFVSPWRTNKVPGGEMISVAALFILLLPTLLFSQPPLPKVDHSAWDSILKEYVNDQHRVDYAHLKANGVPRLNEYIGELRVAGTQPLSLNEKKALLINAYNALTIHWVIEHYPTPSIWNTPTPFNQPHHILGGQRVSLDEIESWLRQMGDPRIHAALVCAAGSCPPLRREAYVANRLDDQLDDNTREWLADAHLNQFHPEKGEAEISPIFKWYRQDFDAYPGGLEGFLRRYAPAGVAQLPANRNLEIGFRDYDWGLNDQSHLGERYSKLQFALAWIKNWFFSLGPKYGVNPLIFGGIYVGAIPFFTLSVGWIIRNLRRKKPVILPLLAASFCFVSAYLYLIIAGKNIPSWVYVFIAAMVLLGVYSTVNKIRKKMAAVSK